MASYLVNYAKAVMVGKTPAIDLDSDTLKIVLLKTLSGDTKDLDDGDILASGDIQRVTQPLRGDTLRFWPGDLTISLDDEGKP